VDVNSGGTCCLHLHGARVYLKLEGAGTSERLLPMCQTALCRIPEDFIGVLIYKRGIFYYCRNTTAFTILTPIL